MAEPFFVFSTESFLLGLNLTMHAWSLRIAVVHVIYTKSLPMVFVILLGLARVLQLMLLLIDNLESSEPGFVITAQFLGWACQSSFLALLGFCFLHAQGNSNFRRKAINWVALSLVTLSIALSTISTGISIIPSVEWTSFVVALNRIVHGIANMFLAGLLAFIVTKDNRTVAEELVSKNVIEKRASVAFLVFEALWYLVLVAVSWDLESWDPQHSLIQLAETIQLWCFCGFLRQLHTLELHYSSVPIIRRPVLKSLDSGSTSLF
ncbi:hypothetical protein BC828DRAFT_387135 [Blastocladiella britannica]|nr:hypothetical protein BC828DRAFT_387135 [Blastocladiella britannica]